MRIRSTGWRIGIALYLSLGTFSPLASALPTAGPWWAGNGDALHVGKGIRGHGVGVLELPPILPGGQIVQAILFWNVLADTPSGASGTFNGIPFTAGSSLPFGGSPIGSGPSPCWPQLSSYSHGTFIDPTWVSPVNVVQFPDAHLLDASPSFEGVSLIVIYQHVNLPLRSVHISYGSDTLIPPAPLSVVSAATTFTDFYGPPGRIASLTCIVADGQPTNDPFEQTQWNGLPVGVGNYEGSAGLMWDHDTFPVPIPTGATSVTGGITTSNDCLVWVAAILVIDIPHSEPIQSVGWVGYDPGDGNTNYQPKSDPHLIYNDDGFHETIFLTPQDRIFAERNQPVGRTGDQLHDKIKVRVVLDPLIFPLECEMTVYFKIFDPDHYSGDSSFDPNGILEGNDNIAAGGAISSPGAELKNASFTASANLVTLPVGSTTNIVEIGMQITAMQPSNNFIVAASTDQTYINDVAINGLDLVDPWGQSAKIPQTSILTVWRTLYVEHDRMELDLDVDRGTSASGVSPSLFLVGNVLAGGTGGDTVQTDLTINAVGGGGDGQFKGGRVRVTYGDGEETWDIFDVVSNTTGANASIVLDRDLPSDGRVPKKVRVLIDDDIVAAGLGNDAVPHCIMKVKPTDLEPDLTQWEDKYIPACVQVNITKIDLASSGSGNVNEADVTFSLNVGEGNDGVNRESARDYFSDLVTTYKQSSSEAGFWVIYQLGVLQGHLKDDADPNSEGFLCGLSYRMPDFSFSGTIVFREVTRETAQLPTTRGELLLWAVTSVHESGHQFGLGHVGDGSIMDPNEAFKPEHEMPTAQLKFSGSGLRKIIKANYPGNP